MDERVEKLTDEEALLKEARDRFKQSVDAEAENRALALDDLEFLSGEQWADSAKKARAGRPCLTINRLPNFIRTVINEQRKTRPAIDVIPADGEASKETADVWQGLIRAIERKSRAKIAYDTAFKYAVSCGFGHFKITTGYCDDDSFDQEIKIERIANPFTVYRDPSSTQPDHSDDRFTFITELISRAEFKSKYGFDAKSLEDVGAGDEMSAWFEDGKVRVAEYWRVIEEEVEIHQTAAGQRLEGKIDKLDPAMMMADPIVASRKVSRKKVEQYLMTCDRIIKKSEWKGKFIPVVTVIGDEWNIEGETKLESLTRHAKDPARMYNYWASAETELVALQPKAPWIAPAGAFDGYEGEWARANTESVAYLEYNPIDGQAPQRQFFAGVPGGVREGRMAAAEDIKAVTGLYDASIGARSNETSGVAIRAREEQGDNATYHFIDNMALAMEFAGKIILDLAPHIYDTARVVNIITPTNDQQTVMINQTFIDPATGQEKTYELSKGKYAVAVKVGPSFESKRQEMVQAVVEMSQANPQLMQIAGDLVMKNMDWPQSEEIAKRIEAMLPPQVKGQQPPPDPNQQMMQAQLQIEQQKAQAALQKAQADIAVKQADAQSQAQQAAADAEIKRIELEIKRIELAVKQQEAQTKGIEAQVKVFEAQSGAQARAEQRDMEMMRQNAPQPAQEAPEPPEPDDKGPDSNAVLASALQGFQVALDGMRAPRKVVRGQDGRVAGIE